MFFMETLTTWKNHLYRWSQVMEEEEEEEEEETRAVQLSISLLTKNRGKN